MLGALLLGGAWEDGGRFPDWPTCWAAPTYDQAKGGFLRYVVKPAERAGILASHTETPPLQATLINRSIVVAKSWDNPSGIYSFTYARIGVDEFGQLTDEGWLALSSRTTEPAQIGGGQIRMAGNVGEIGGTAERLVRIAQSGRPGWAARTWTWRDRARAARCVCGLNGEGIEIEHASLHDPLCFRGIYLQSLADRMGSMSSLQFRQLYGAEWLDWSALPVYTFERAVHVTEAVEYQSALALDLACDFNVAPMAWVVGQHRADEAWALGEIDIPGSATTQLACQEFLRQYPVEQYNPKGKRALNVYGDASGKSHGTKSTETDYTIIEQTLRSLWPQMQFHIPPSNPPVTDRVNAVNALLKSASGGTRYYIHPRCTKLADDYARVGYKPGTRDLDKGDKSRTHFSDAEGYRLVELFPVRGVIREGATVVTRDPFYDGGIMTAEF